MTDALDAAVTPAKRRKLAKVILEKALGGDPWAIAFLFDRIDGKVPQRIDLTGMVRQYAEEAGLSEEDTEAAVQEAAAIVRSQGA